jgi:tRNA pseudouridine55 synthase
MDGLLVLDKPAGITSRDAVDQAARWFPPRTRIGHTGTLDPLATGVLVLCLGVATRLSEYVQDMDKVYESTFLLGATSDTDDADGVVEEVKGAMAPVEAKIRAALDSFLGEIEQVPPAFSAIKVEGRHAYHLARRGKTVKLQPRRIRIYGIELLSYAYPVLNLRIHCGKGTYIRSLARDLGKNLGCGGLVQMLRRTRIGPFKAENALQLAAEAGRSQAELLPCAMALSDLPAWHLSAEDAHRLRLGQFVPWQEKTDFEQDRDIAVFDASGNLVGVARFLAEKKLLRPHKIIPIAAGNRS